MAEYSLQRLVYRVLMLTVGACLMATFPSSEADAQPGIPCATIRIYFSDASHSNAVGAIWRGEDVEGCYCQRCQYGTLFTPHYEDQPNTACGGC